MGFPVPSEIRATLEPLMAGVPWGEIEVELRTAIPKHEGPSAYMLRAPYAVTLSHEDNLVPIGASIGRTVFLDAQHADATTAAGLALWAHEFRHQAQRASLFGFPWRFDLEERRRRLAGEPVWGNRYEAEAYRDEARIYCELLAMGYPKGTWTPLGYQIYGCEAAAWRGA